MVRKFMCIFLVLSLLVTLTGVPVSASYAEASQPETIRETYVLDGHLCYYENGPTRVINAVVFEDTIDIALAYNDQFDMLYHASVPTSDYDSDLSDPDSWSYICEDAMEIMTGQIIPVESTEIVQTPENMLMSSNDSIYELFMEELEAIYGEGGTSDIIGSSLIDTENYVYATVTEYYNPYVEYVMQKKSAVGMTVQLFATFLGFSASTVAQAFGVGLSYTFPANTTAHIYYCHAYYERYCTADGTLYYTAEHDIVHKGLLDPTNLYDDIVGMEEDPYLDLYSPSSSVYNSFSQLIAYTKQAYEEDNN